MLFVNVYSFSYRDNPLHDSALLAKLGDRKDAFIKHGGGYAFDCRFLKNPGLVPEIKEFTGNDQVIIDYLNNVDGIEPFKTYTREILNMVLSSYIEKCYDTLFIGFGCTGGRHRSVYMANYTYDWVNSRYPSTLIHTNI